MENREIFKDFLISAFEKGQYATDDVIAFVLPLFEEVLSFHENNQVAPFEREDSLFITDLRIDIDETFAHAPKTAHHALKELFASYETKYLEITGKTRLEANVNDGTYKQEDLQVHTDPGKPLKDPAFIPGYTCY